MNNYFKIEILLSSVLILLTVALLDPFMFLLPGSSVMILMVVLAIVFISYLAFFWKEKALDEREDQNRRAAGRIAWLTGAVLLVVGILYEGIIDHHVDGWLIISLVGMLLAKIIGRVYLDNKN